MVDASRNTGEFLNSIGDPRFREYAQSIIQMSVDGKSTAEVFLKIADQVDEIKKRFPGATGVDIAGRYLESLHLPRELARTGGQDLRERLAVQERLGTTGAEMKEAQVQAELLRDKLFRGGIILDRWGVILKTDITNAFLKINDLLDKIDAKYNAFFGGGGIMRKLIGPNTYDQMFPPTFSERFSGDAGGGGGGAGGGGGGVGVVPTAPGGGGGAATSAAPGFSGRFGSWAPATLSGHSGHVPSDASGPLGSLNTGGPNITAPPPAAGGADAGCGTGINRDQWLAELEANPCT